MSMAILSLFWVLAVFSFTCGNGGLLHTEAYSSDQTYRTAYHFQPPRGFLNDPIGLMRFRGVYHLFYPKNMWGYFFWAHSVSNDLVNWTLLDPAIDPSQPFDINGCLPGSATVLPWGEPAIIYSALDSSNRNVQNLAYPRNVSDPFLREWVKSPQNPIMEPTSANKIDASNFAHPTTAWLGKDGHWRILTASKNQSTGKGMGILYRSQDFKIWINADEPLFSAEVFGMFSNTDFYPVLINSSLGVDVSVNEADVKHVLKFSFLSEEHDYYLIGSYSYDAAKDVFIPNDKTPLRYDYGKYYASKSFFDDGENRRVLFGSILESSTMQDSVKRGWYGIQALPRSIWLHKSGKHLVQWPVVEIEKLRANPLNLPPKVLKGGELLQVNGVTASQADVEISFEVEKFEKAEVLDDLMEPQTLCSEKGAKVPSGLGPFGLLVFASKDLREYTAVFFIIFKYQNNNVVLMCSDQSRSSLNQDNDMTSYGTFVDVDPVQEKLSLRSLIDHSVVESFGVEGRACITARVYPTLAINDQANLYAFNNGTVDVNITRLSAWSMNKAQIN